MSSIGSRILSTLKTKPQGRYQIQGVRFAEQQGGRVLISDEMGCGKTWQAIAYAAIHPELRPVVVVCPATIKFQWKDEWKHHAGLKAHVVGGHILTDEQAKAKFEASLQKLKRKAAWKHAPAFVRLKKIKALRNHWKGKLKKQQEKLRRLRSHKILIINYDILSSWVPFLASLNPMLLIIDECQRIKSPKAQMSSACRELSKACKHIIELSGTPISGKPIEFWSALNILRPTQFPSYWRFGLRYGKPQRNRWSGGWNFLGASHLKELHTILKDIMIRRLKKDVLKDLPTKTRTIIPVEITNRNEYREAEERFLAWLLKRKGKAAFDRAQRAKAIVQLLHLKILAAKGKMKTAIRWIRDWMESSDEKLLVFTLHKEIMGKLRKAFPKAVYVDGSVSIKKRKEVVDKFQGDKRCRLFFGQMKAAGVGINLTAANNVLILELPWDFGTCLQAEDRAYRIGTVKNVQVHYMVGRKTIEQRIMEILKVKSDVVDRILEGKKSGVTRLLQHFLKRVS